MKFIRELKKLIGIYSKDTKGIERIYLWFRMHPNIPKYLNFSIYVNKFLEIYRKKKVAETEEYIELKKNVDRIKEREERHYRQIIYEAQKYVLK